MNIFIATYYNTLDDETETLGAYRTLKDAKTIIQERASEIISTTFLTSEERLDAFLELGDFMLDATTVLDFHFIEAYYSIEILKLED